MAAESGGIDVSFNLISHGDVQGTPLAEMTFADFERPVITAIRATFLTARAAARHVIGQGSGVILVFGGYGDPSPGHYLGGLQVAFQAMEALRRNLASELGPHGIRVLTLQTGGIPESIPERFEGRDAIAEEIEREHDARPGGDPRGRRQRRGVPPPRTGRVMTATALNITCGSVVD